MDFTNIIENNLRDHLVVSDYDRESFKGVELCLGIDEAGRGPVLGPMVYGALFCPIDKEQHLKEMKCADSKQLTEDDREKIFKRINEENKFCGFAVHVLSPHTISTSMLRKVKYNLNELSHDTAMGLIDKLYNGEKLNITHVYLDTVGDPGKYEQKILKRFPKLKIKVSKKADSIYPCVSAASICAKVTRDSVLKSWRFLEDCHNTKFGSGYPGDPVTKKFLDDNLDPVFGFVKLVRFSWSTAANKLQAKSGVVAVQWADGEDDNDHTASHDAADDNEEDENNEVGEAKKKQPVKKQDKKGGGGGGQKSRLDMAVAKEKNNTSLLSFFQKSTPQKRAAPTASIGEVEIKSQFMISRKIKECKSF